MKITFIFFMFRDAPGCSGMFHVPGFIDARTKLYLTQGWLKECWGLEIFYFRIFWGRKIFAQLDLSGDFFEYSKQSEDLW